jgi:hypothetical protein
MALIYIFFLTKISGYAPLFDLTIDAMRNSFAKTYFALFSLMLNSIIAASTGTNTIIANN